MSPRSVSARWCARVSLAIVVVIVVVIVAALAAPIVVTAGASCDRVAALAMRSAKILEATIVPAGDPAFHAARAFCRVTIAITPTTESDIRAEVWLPLEGWNGKFQAVGNSDAAGVISHDAMADAVGRGFATSSTDTGHAGNSMAFALGHRQKYIDFGYRATHEMTLAAKAIVTAFFGTPPRVSLWNGCSQGGRQGITEAARYPADYDAIIAGAAAIDNMKLHADRLALNVFVNRSRESYIPSQKYPAIHRAALAACDATDGVTDGLIGDPTRCRFDPRTIQCAADDGPTCLTRAQVETATGIYALLQPGSELEWDRLAGQHPLRNAVEPFRYVVFNDPAWDWRTFRRDVDLPRALAADDAVISLTDPDLRPYFDRGGKLLMFHGWADPQIPPSNSVAYFREVLEKAGQRANGASIALYMQPGVSHCWGGDGPDTFDSVAAIDEWMATGRAPARILALQTTGSQPDRTRPLCPYPQRATYKGKGSLDSADNFICR